MRKAKTVQKVQFLAPDTITKVIPSPTDGWDAISPLAEMDPKRAPILINWVPRPGYVELRAGYIPFASIGVISAIESLMVYRSPTKELLFAAGNDHIYDTSNGTATSVVSGLSNNRWQYVNFTPGNGTTVIQCVNGQDQLRMYNGTAWTTPSITGLPGGTTANIININSQKRRLWYIMNNSTVAAFMPTDAIQGPIDGTLDLGSLWVKGGYLVTMSAWTIDGGSGPQDYALFISSRGEVAIYSGTDPTNSNAWFLLGTFQIAPPIGRRCAYRLGSDVAIITQQGVIPISQALPFDPSADRSVAITSRIQNAMSMASQQSKNLFGWQFLTFPNQQLAILNVPIAENSSQQQYVMNTLTGAWCQFIGWNANCFEIFEDNLYFGDNSGFVNQGYVGSTDLFAPITADMQCAFNWLDDPGKVKRMTMVQPLLNLSANLNPFISVDTDFRTSTAVAPITVFGNTVVWDLAVWDVDVWPPVSVTYTNWLSVDAIGHNFAIRMRVNLLTASATDFGVFDLGVFDAAEFDAAIAATFPVIQVNAFNAIAEMGGAI